MRVKTPLSDEGLRAWISFYNAHNAESVELGGDLRAAWAKLEGYAARLALVVHFIRWAADDPTLADPNAVDERSMKAGIALSRWFGGEARRVYALLCESDEDAERRKLVEWIQGKGGSTTVRDLTRGPREYRGDSDAAEKALNGLVKCGLGRWEAGDATSKGGRPTRYFILNDTGDGDRTPPNPPLHEVSSPSPPLIQKANV